MIRVERIKAPPPVIRETIMFGIVGSLVAFVIGSAVSAKFWFGIAVGVLGGKPLAAKAWAALKAGIARIRGRSA